MHRLTAPAALALALLALSCDDDQPVAADMLQQPDRHVVDNAMPGDSASEQGCITPPEMGPVDGPRADLSLDATADAWPDRSVPPDLPGSDAAADATVDLPASDTVAADAPATDAPAADAPATDAPATDATVPDATVPDAPVPDATVPDTVSGPCPPCMELMGGTFCIDRYEASRPDATSSYQGVQNTKAMCQPYVMPWYSMVLSKTEAQMACAAAGKRLCSEAEWKLACSGPKKMVYAYGNSYSPILCNGIDTFCFCGPGQPCAGVSPCPYPHCFNQPPPGGGPPAYCSAWFHVMPTGSFVGCVTGDGIFDLNGNVWELIDTPDGLNHFRGGAYNCSNSETLHRCDYDATWGPSAQGFRCCADPL